jgi:hypothetical protein
VTLKGFGLRHGRRLGLRVEAGTNKMYNDPPIVPFGSHFVDTSNGELKMESKLDRLISSVSGCGCGGRNRK